MNDIIDGIYVRTQGYGTPFHMALTCLRCGAMVDGNQYTPVPPRQNHAQWHEVIDELTTDLRERELTAAEAVERD